MVSAANFSAGEIQQQLSEILRSPAFQASPTLSRFLTFIVEESLAGRKEQLKEYVIGVNVMHKPAGYNPQQDANVRIHAIRLRNALNQYYNNEGRHSPLLIQVPSGSYKPEFSHPAQQPDFISGKSNRQVEMSHLPVLAILPLSLNVPDPKLDTFKAMLEMNLITEFSKFDELAVISDFTIKNTQLQSKSIMEIAHDLGASYLLSGNMIISGDVLEIGITLTSGSRGTIVCNIPMLFDLAAQRLEEIKDIISEELVSAIPGYYGAIMRDIARVNPEQQTNAIQTNAMSWYCFHEREFSQHVFTKACNAVEAVLKTDPEFALGWAWLGDMYVDGLVVGFINTDQPVEKALRCAKTALKIDVRCQHAYWTLAWIHLVMKNKAEAIESIDQCIEINPKNNGARGAMGFGLICAGEYERGYKLIMSSLKRSPYFPWWFNAGICIYYFWKMDYDASLLWADKMERDDIFWVPLLKTVNYRMLGEQGKAAIFYNDVRLLLGEKNPDLTQMIHGLLIDESLANKIADTFLRAGNQYT